MNKMESSGLEIPKVQIIIPTIEIYTPKIKTEIQSIQIVSQEQMLSLIQNPHKSLRECYNFDEETSKTKKDFPFLFPEIREDIDNKILATVHKEKNMSFSERLFSSMEPLQPREEGDEESLEIFLSFLSSRTKCNK